VRGHNGQQLAYVYFEDEAPDLAAAIREGRDGAA